MKFFTTSTLLLLGVNLTLASAVPYKLTITEPEYLHLPRNEADDPRDSIICETSEGSPLTGDAVDASGFLINGSRPDNCRQRTFVGSDCTRITWSGGASVALCGLTGKKIDCRRLGRSVLAIVDKCASDGRVGGYRVYAGETARVVIY